MLRLIALVLFFESPSLWQELQAQSVAPWLGLRSSQDAATNKAMSCNPPCQRSIPIHAFYLPSIQVQDESPTTVTWQLGLHALFDVHTGLFVREVQLGSPASVAGIHPGMRILAIDGRPATSLRAIEEALDEISGIISLKIQRTPESSPEWMAFELASVDETQASDEYVGRDPVQQPHATDMQAFIR